MPPPIVQKRPIQWSDATYAKRLTRTIAGDHLKVQKRCHHKKVIKKVIDKIHAAERTINRCGKLMIKADRTIQDGTIFIQACQKDTVDSIHRLVERDNGRRVYYKLKRADKRAAAKAKARYEAKKSASA